VSELDASAEGAPAPGTAQSSAQPPDTRPALLCLSQSFAPDTTPTGIRATQLVRRLAGEWDVTVLTEAGGAAELGGVDVRTVRSRRPRRLLTVLRRLRLDKLIELLVWPDDSIFWLAPAIAAGRRALAERRPQAIVVFMMPYSSGLAGVALSRRARVPLVLNLDDSPMCTDMHPRFPTRLHHRLARALEDFYARHADAVVYVSQVNLDAVRARQPPPMRKRFHLVRYGADVEPRELPAPAPDRFEIAYVGAMSGWWSLIEQDERPGLARRALRAWNRLGRYEAFALDERTSSPLVIGRAIHALAREHPQWAGRMGLAIYGNPYPEDVVARALAAAGIDDVVTVSGPVAHEQVAALLARADLLFITLPSRPDGSRGGRISAKTYEYLATGQPILAAVPRGENRDYLDGRPGVWLVAPDDESGMRNVVERLAQAKLAGKSPAFDRSGLREELSYDTRAREFAAVIRAAVEQQS
jgi:glycosyltransferase involved in cell wall biosynthesis